ncbi:hypothetical protein [Nocardia sp. AG03]|uniref:hypothetical protein n=1 Tax=Nocardia sp. AG03 TaxID=3025312 RepID=UPI0024184340|nr:hypothetical protein [Nocardia sp. AG03]
MDPEQIRAVHRGWESIHSDLDQAVRTFAAQVDEHAHRHGAVAAVAALAAYLRDARSMVDDVGQVAAQAKLIRTAIESAHHTARWN